MALFGGARMARRACGEAMGGARGSVASREGMLAMRVRRIWMGEQFPHPYPPRPNRRFDLLAEVVHGAVHEGHGNMVLSDDGREVDFGESGGRGGCKSGAC
mmetsp:Transcript_4373/g.10715  ORF Transcript_4373/g.10715 Transcript_4373/m.10715 type:complete len:101 (+) Transcript_4373:1488-1790(+)